MITLHDEKETKATLFKNNGLGVLRDCISAEVVEEINGDFSLEIEYPKTGRLFEKLKENMIIVCDVGYGDEQAFRIRYYDLTLKTIKIYASHIFYDLADNLLEDVYPKNLSGASAGNWILSRTQYNHDFTFSSDVAKSTSARYVRKNPVEAFIGTDDNSFINRWGGEIERNNFAISIVNKRQGLNKKKYVRYRKNLKGLTYTLDFSTVVTRAMPVGYDGLLLPEKYIDSPLINKYFQPIIKTLDYPGIKIKTSDTDEEGFETEEEAFTSLREAVQNDFQNGVDKPEVSSKIDFVKLSDTEEYKNFKVIEDLIIGDTINVHLEEFDIDVEQRIVKTTYNVLTQKFTRYELGTVKANYANQSVSEATRMQQIILPNLLDLAKKSATNQIANALGGYVYKTNNELFIMDTDDPKTARKVWRWNLNGLGYSSSGIAGPYGLALTQDGQIVADFIKTGTMSVDRIEGLSNTLKEYAEISLQNKRIAAIVSNTVDITKEVDETTSYLVLEDCMKGNLLQLSIYGNINNDVFGNKIIDSSTSFDNSTELYTKNATIEINHENLREGHPYVTANLDMNDHHYNIWLQRCKSVSIPILPNRTYTVTKKASSRFALGTFEDFPTAMDIATNYVSDANEGYGLTKLEITSGENDTYLVVFFYDGYYDSNLEEIYESIVVRTGYQKIDLEIDEPLRAIKTVSVQNGKITNEKITADEVQYSDGFFYLIRRIGYDSGNTYILNEEIVTLLTEKTIELYKCDNSIKISDYYSTRMYAKYVKRNEFTDIFTTQVEMNAAIEILSNAISLAVTQDNLMASINLKIENGESGIDFKSDLFSLISKYTQITREGELTTAKGNIAGWDISTDSLTKGLAGIVSATEDELQSFKEIFYVGKGLGEDGNSAWSVNTIGHMRGHAIDLYCLDNNQKYPSYIKIYAANSQTGTVIESDNISTGHGIFGDGIARGYAMHSPDLDKFPSNNHTYWCHFNDPGNNALVFQKDANKNSNFTASSWWISSGSSDERLKHDIEPISEDLLKLINELELKQFIFNSDGDHIVVGVIAQDFLRLIEKYNLDKEQIDKYEIVRYGIDATEEVPDGYMAVDYQRIQLLKIKCLEIKTQKQERKIDFIINKLGYEDEIKEIIS